MAMAPSMTESETPKATATMAHRRRGIGSPSHAGAAGVFRGGVCVIAKTKIRKAGVRSSEKGGVGVANAPKGKMLLAQMEGGKRRGWSEERREGWSGGACKTGRVDAEWKDGGRKNERGGRRKMEGRKNGEEAQNGEKASAKTGRVTGRKWRGGRRENGRADAKMRGRGTGGRGAQKMEGPDRRRTLPVNFY